MTKVPLKIITGKMIRLRTVFHVKLKNKYINLIGNAIKMSFKHSPESQEEEKKIHVRWTR